MENVKYVFTEETVKVCDHTLHRIKAARDFSGAKTGELGGFIEKEENLSHHGDAWVRGDAQVCGDARVCDNAQVCGDAQVCDNAQVCGNAWVRGDAQVCGNAWVRGDAQVRGNARVYDNAQVCGDARVCGDAQVCDNAQVCGDAQVCGNAKIQSGGDYFCVTGAGSRYRTTTFFKTSRCDIFVKCGCFEGTLSEFVEKVHETHAGTKYEQEYLAAVELVRIHFAIAD